MLLKLMHKNLQLVKIGNYQNVEFFFSQTSLAFRTIQFLIDLFSSSTSLCVKNFITRLSQFLYNCSIINDEFPLSLSFLIAKLFCLSFWIFYQASCVIGENLIAHFLVFELINKILLVLFLENYEPR